MKLEEILVKCDKCVQENERQPQKQSVNQDDESGKVPNESGSSSEELLNEEDSQLEAVVSSVRPAIVKCVECDLHFCANCILDHQIQNESANHKLITVLPGLGELNETAKNASAFMILNSTRGLDEALQAHQSSDSSPIIEKKRDCHASEFLNEGFLKVTDESYQEGLIKRRDSNIDKSSIENKMTPPATANHTASKLDEEDSSKEDLSSVIAEQPLHQQLGDKESKVDTGSIVDFLNEFNGDKLKLHGVEQAFQQQHQLPTNQLIQQQLLLKLKQQESRYRFQSSGQQAVGSNNRLTQIEAEINKTFSFYVQVLKERKEYLVKELNTIVQFAVLNHSQNINKQVQVQYQLELKKQQLEKELNDCYDMLNEQANGGASTGSNANVSIDEASVKSKLNLLNELNNLISMNNQLIAQLKSTNPLSSIEFISNYSAIQTSIRNTFGLIRINQQGSSNGVSVSSSSTSINQGYVSGGNKSHGFNHHASGPLNVICDKTLTSSSQHSLLSGQSSSGVSATASSTSLFPSNSSTSMASSTSVANELITSPVSTINKKHASTSSLPSFAAHEQWKSNQLGDYMLAGNELMMDQVVNGDDELLKLKSSYAEQMSAFEQGNGIRENPMITLSAGSTSSSKSTKSSSSNSSCKFSPTTASQGSSNYAYDSGNLFMPQQHQQQNSGVAHHASSSTSSFGGHHHHYKPHLMPNGGAHQFSHHGSHHNPFGRLYSLYDLTLKNSLQLTRSKMIYHCKFGEFGINDGQFTEPSGVTINTNNDIIVADTNSHRIQIFDREGNFKFKFGECGKRDGQLLYPNRVSIVKQTGDIVVTERSPTHQIQIYNKYGQFLRKFGANILQHPRGVFVDHKGRIVVVECKVMRVIIFDLFGNVLNKFNCSKYLEFPNGVCCSNPNASNNYREEIYISDNRAHCIKVFDYNGNFLRQIGGEGITNYPIGVGINSNNEILVADNHNNFNLTVFTQDGKLINALESKVKHAQCFDVGLMDDGSIVLASKDYRIYVYKYSTSEGMSSPIVASPTNPISASSSTMNANSSTLFPSSITNGHQVNKYELFSDCNNNNSTPGSGIQHSPGGLYNYFKPNVSDGLTNNIAGLFSELSAHASSGNSAAFQTASHLESNFFADSAALSAAAAAAASNNDISHNESTSLLNLSTNTTTTNNLVSILNGIL